MRNEFGEALNKASPDKAQGWVVSDAGAVYVLGAVPVPQDDEPELQVSLEAEALNRSALEAVTLMARHMAEGRLDKRKFEDEDAADLSYYLKQKALHLFRKYCLEFQHRYKTT